MSIFRWMIKIKNEITFELKETLIREFFKTKFQRESNSMKSKF